MSVTALIVSLLNAVALGQSSLGALILAPKARSGSIYLPLSLFFTANALTELASLVTLPLFFEVNPLYSALTGFASIPVICVLAPLFWIYVRGLTSEHSNIWIKRDGYHLGLGFIALALPLIALLMPSADLLALFSPNDYTQSRSTTQKLLIIAIKTVDILVIVQVGFYIVLIVNRLSTYRKKLAQLFASTEHLELRWFRWLALFMLAYFVLSALSLLVDTMFRSPHSITLWEALVDVGLITTLCVWGLRQQPNLAIEARALKVDDLPAEKYRNSALSVEQCKALSVKIQNAMQSDKLYRKENVSLRVLAKHIGELPSYVTQTLNTEIGSSFFDYVNKWRIDEAALRLSNSDDTVLAIATDVGFNSRSSFYNAFKKIKKVTPSAYRKRRNSPG